MQHIQAKDGARGGYSFKTGFSDDGNWLLNKDLSHSTSRYHFLLLTFTWRAKDPNGLEMHYNTFSSKILELGQQTQSPLCSQKHLD